MFLLAFAIGFAIGNEADDVTKQVALGAVAQAAGLFTVSSLCVDDRAAFASSVQLAVSHPMVLRAENKEPG